MMEMLNELTQAPMAFPIFIGLVAMALITVCELKRRRIATRNRSLELDLEDRDRQLRNASRELEMLFDHTSIAVLILDKQSRLAEYGNQLALEAFGAETLAVFNSEILVKPDAWSPAPYSLEQFESYLGQARDIGHFQFEWYFAGAPTYARWHQFTINHLVFDGRQCLLLTGVNTTERKLIEGKRERRNNALTSMASRRELHESLGQVINMLETVYPDFHCGIMVTDEERQCLRWVSAPRLPERFLEATDNLQIQYGQAASGTAAALKSRVVSQDIGRDPRWTSFLSAADEVGFKACWSEPIISSCGQVLGTLCIYHTHPWEPGEGEIDAVTEPLYLASLALEDVLTRRKLERSVEQEHLLRHLSTTLLENEDDTSGQGLIDVLRTVGEYLELAHAYIYEQTSQDSPFVRSHHWSADDDSGCLPIGEAPGPNDIKALLEALQSDGYYILGSSQGRTAAPSTQALPGSSSAGTTLFIPLYGNQRLSGILGFDSADGRSLWNTSTVNTLCVIGNLVSHSLTRRNLLRSLEFKALHDRLTGLFNRHKIETALKQEIQRTERYGNALSLLIIDVDYFKQVNDTHGHGAGDEVLVGLAGILRNEVRAADITGRWGGEEFLVLLPETDLNGAYNMAEQLRQTVQNHAFPIEREITISIGLASYCTGDTPDLLVNRADEGLYQAKENGRNRVQIAPAARAPADGDFSTIDRLSHAAPFFPGGQSNSMARESGRPAQRG